MARPGRAHCHVRGRRGHARTAVTSATHCGRRFELRHLRYFLAVAQAGNVTKAAEQCFVAQSALSSQIGRLEAELGSELFLRSTRGMRLTSAGETLRPLASRLLAEAARVEEEMAALRGVVAGRLRLGMIQGPPAHLDIVELVAAFHRLHPGVELQVHTGASADLARDVLDGLLDLAVVALREPSFAATLSVTALIDDPLVAVFSRQAGLTPETAVSVAQLLEHGPFIHYRHGSGLRRSVTAAFERAGVEVEAPFELDQVSDMVRLAMRGVGVTIVPSSVLRLPQFSDETSFTAVPLADAAALHTISAVTPDPPSPAAQAFLHLLLA